MINSSLSSSLKDYMSEAINLFHHDIPTLKWFIKPIYLVAQAPNELPSMWLLDKGLHIRRIPTTPDEVTILLEEPEPFLYTFTWDQVIEALEET